MSLQNNDDAIYPFIIYGLTYSNNSSAVSDESFEYVWPFCGVGS